MSLITIDRFHILILIIEVKFKDPSEVKYLISFKCSKNKIPQRSNFKT